MEIPNGHNQEMALIHPPPSNFPQQEKMMPKYQQNQILAPNYSCPRCDSTNTKFCYYNNYSLSQPRYFCKACRRYWTKGGILRNVPVGGGCRKNKIRPSDDSSAAAFTTKKSLLSPSGFQNINITKLPPAESTPNFRIPNDGLTLAFNPFLIDEQNPNNPNPSFLDILRGGGVVGPAGQESHRGGPPSLCYGFGNHHHQRGVLNFHAGGTAPLTADRAPGMAVVGDEEGEDDNVAAAGLGLEITGGRDYWNDGAGSVSSSSSTWHGLVNGSFL